jgi:hypothetical protein
VDGVKVSGKRPLWTMIPLYPVCMHACLSCLEDWHPLHFFLHLQRDISQSSVVSVGGDLTKVSMWVAWQWFDYMPALCWRLGHGISWSDILLWTDNVDWTVLANCRIFTLLQGISRLVSGTQPWDENDNQVIGGRSSEVSYQSVGRHKIYITWVHTFVTLLIWNHNMQI